MKQQINFRASDLTAATLGKLIHLTGMSQTEVISVAIDRMYREETMTTKMTKQQAIDYVGDVAGQAYPVYNTHDGFTCWREDRTNGVVEYEFTMDEEKHASEINGAEDLPWDDEHIARVWTTDGDLVFGSR